MVTSPRRNRWLGWASERHSWITFIHFFSQTQSQWRRTQVPKTSETLEYGRVCADNPCKC